MTGEEFRKTREWFDLGRDEFALLIGYVGSDRNNNFRIRKMEKEEEISLPIARLLWLIAKHKTATGELPHWPAHLRIEGETEPWK